MSLLLLLLLVDAFSHATDNTFVNFNFIYLYKRISSYTKDEYRSFLDFYNNHIEKDIYRLLIGTTTIFFPNNKFGLTCFISVFRTCVKISVSHSIIMFCASMLHICLTYPSFSFVLHTCVANLFCTCLLHICVLYLYSE